MVAPALIATLFLALPGQHADAPPAQAWMGVSLSEDLDAPAPGLEITRVFQGSPAERSGLRAGDRLMSIDDRPLSTYEDLQELMRDQRPGGRGHVWVRRDVTVRLDDEYRFEDRPRLGVMLERGKYPGMVAVTEVVEGSPADAAGLRDGDQLRELGGQPTASVAQLRRALSEQAGDGPVVVGISRRLSIQFSHAPQNLAAPQAPREPREPREPRAEREDRRDRRDVERAERGRTEDRLRDIERERERMYERYNIPEPNRFERRPEPRGEPLYLPRSMDEAGLREELRVLADDLRSLREELGALRGELEALRRDRRGR